MIRKYIKRIIFIFLVALTQITFGQGLRTQGKSIINAQGEEVLLRGMGLGGWALIEGYMLQSAHVANTQHQLRSRLITLMGIEYTDTFFEQWRANYCTKEDIDSLAKWGFNSVRLPMHYNLFTLPIENEPVTGQHTWFATGFDMIDSLLSWCKPHEMYVILDLHAAPGGQGYNEGIADYDPTKPSLWESKANRDKMVALWQKLAERYKDEEWIGGYDLLNEPNWDLPGGTALRNLYGEVTDSIRSTGDEHIIFIEGNWFANDHTGLTPPWDDNFVYSFHKYWDYNEQANVNWILPKRDDFDVPLWMGESGENSNTWFNDAITILEDNDIGWAWWTLKKVEFLNSPYSVPMSPGFQKIMDYWDDSANPKPTIEEAFAGMMELADNLLIENAFYHPDVIDAMIRQVQTDETIPFRHHTIPGVVNMSDYDLGKNEFAYYDTESADYHQSTGQFQAWNSGWTYRNDGVDIESNDHANTNGYHIGFTADGEWINYTVFIEESGLYDLEAQISAQTVGGKFHFSLDGYDLTLVQTAPATGGWVDFAPHLIQGIILDQGKHTITFHVDGSGAFNIARLLFTKVDGEVSDVPFIALNGHTMDDEQSVRLVLKHSISPETIDPSVADFRVFVNGDETTIATVFLDDQSDRTLIFTFDEVLRYTDIIKISYNGSTLKSVFNTSLETFNDLRIQNELPIRHVIPGRVQSENFEYMTGLQTETTTDDGGGLNVGYTDVGDYADYLVNVESAGDYHVNFRLAAPSQRGKIGLYLVSNTGEEELMTINVPGTGGWQSWVTESGQVTLPIGVQKLRMKVLISGFNINWMEFDVVLNTDGSVTNKPLLYPNPTNGYVYLNTTEEYEYFVVFDLSGSRIEGGYLSKAGRINLTELGPGMYMLKLLSNKGNQPLVRKIIKTQE